ncbi:hypothetical protein [Microbacterium binotii]|uniref:hypothetical protein n=1 Tax=Microbacterium binotii TaxID=462710 RepID=UPI001F39EF91|nr:hypothetical protein [Microbacterium binotii]UIN31592.1 hypothetical protein LXM64_05175 [Microbacterium binotii]
MQAMSADPNGLWPPGMTVTVKNDSAPLLELLWIREAWDLRPTGDVPPPLATSPHRTGRAAPPEWADEWSRLWSACLEHAGRSTETELIARLGSTPLGSAERAELLRRLMGASWRDSFGDDAFDESYVTWRQELLEGTRDADAVPLEETPERRAVTELASAWRIGLSVIVTIPCTGEYTRRVSDTALLVTDGTRQDPRRYAAALASF